MHGNGDWSERTIRPKTTKNIIKSNPLDLADKTSICDCSIYQLTLISFFELTQQRGTTVWSIVVL
jgi:hypothetical protein